MTVFPIRFQALSNAMPGRHTEGGLGSELDLKNSSDKIKAVELRVVLVYKRGSVLGAGGLHV